MNKREDWWEYTKRIIRSYPALCRKAESVGDIPCTPAYGASGGHSGGGSPVERAVVDRLTDKEQRRYATSGKRRRNAGTDGLCGSSQKN